MYTSTLAIVGVTSLAIQLFTKIHGHCKESECDCSCYDKIRQILFPPKSSLQPRLRRMEPLAE